MPKNIAYLKIEEKNMELLPPLFVQVAITFVLLLAMAFLRVKSIKSGKVHPKDVALGQPNWMEKATKFGNSYHNQLQIPVLFYLLIVLLMVTNLADSTFLYCAWGYVGLRLLHAIIHVSNNNILMRFYAFAASNVLLMVMWGRFGLAVM
jgi:hypothetical protein